MATAGGDDRPSSFKETGLRLSLTTQAKKEEQLGWAEAAGLVPSPDSSVELIVPGLPTLLEVCQSV